MHAGQICQEQICIDQKGARQEALRESSARDGLYSEHIPVTGYWHGCQYEGARRTILPIRYFFEYCKRMKPLITNNLAIWTTAPKGIKKLRELILELAVRGLLVPQDVNDEPASELLKKIAAEKARLVSEGKIKKQIPPSPPFAKGGADAPWEKVGLQTIPHVEKYEIVTALPVEKCETETVQPYESKGTVPLFESSRTVPPFAKGGLGGISLVEQPFALPTGWEWVRLQQIIQISSGDGLTSENMNKNGSIPVYGGNGITGYHDKENTEKPTLVIGRVGYYCGSIHITPSSAWVTDNAFKTTFSEENINIAYLFWLLKVTNLKENEAATAQPVISGRKIYPIVVGLPPLAEQQRIVAKVDELMQLCDRLEQKQSDSEQTHRQLVSGLLTTLTEATDTQALSAAWSTIAANFDCLITTEYSIEQLKQTILQLAVMGKLVPQNPNDEPASELLKKIAAEKARLVGEGKIKKQIPLPKISEEEMPFALPMGWEWVRLNDLTKIITKGSSPKWQGVTYSENPNDVLFITSENVGRHFLKLESPKYVEHKFNEIEPRSILEKGDFLMNIVGASIGRTAIFDIEANANVNQAVCLIRCFIEQIDSKFFLYFFNSEICLEYMFDKQVDNARANLSMGNIAKFVIPLPPLAEQHRIVTKVDELLTLCEQLQARLATTETLQQQLAETLVRQAVV